MSGRLTGKVALISGAARGQGAAEARLFADEGASVVLGDILVNEGEALAGEIDSSGAAALFTPLDVTDEIAWSKAVQLAISRFGKIDVLVNNAGVTHKAGMTETDLTLWNRIVSVNQTGTFLGMRAAIPHMRAMRSGSIVNVSSICAFVGTGTGAAYHATKGAILALTRTAAIELAADGVRVNSIHPGAIETAMLDDSVGTDPTARAAMVASHPLGKIGTGLDVAYAALYLASEEAGFVTGTSLVVDGGFTAQ